MEYLSNTNEYEIKINVNINDIDNLGHVNNITYLRWVQEVSGEHWKNNTDLKIQKAYHWVVLRHEIDYYKPAFAGDELIAKTTVVRFEGVKSLRSVEFLRDGFILAKSLTIWCLIDAGNGRPLRVPQQIQELFIKE